jgi:hypothetical protein
VHLVQTHGHGADEGFDASGRLVVGGAESPAHILVIQDLYFEGEVLLQLGKWEWAVGGRAADRINLEHC